MNNFNFLLQIPIEFRESFLSNIEDLLTGIENEVVIPINQKYSKEATMKLRDGYKAMISQSGLNIKISVHNTAIDKNYPQKYYWMVVRDGRQPFKNIPEKTPPWRSIKSWMDSKNISGSPFVMAKSINEKGFKGTPKMFIEMEDLTKDYIINKFRALTIGG